MPALRECHYLFFLGIEALLNFLFDGNLYQVSIFFFFLPKYKLFGRELVVRGGG